VRPNLSRTRVFAAIIAAALLSSPVVAGPPAATSRGAVDLSAVRIDNFGRVNDGYYRGAQPMGADYETLAALGVRTLINLTSHDAAADEEEMARRAGLSYFQIPMTTRKAPTEGQLKEFLRLVNDAANQPVYVHCVGGRHRTGVMTAVYRMAIDGWTSDQAYNEMKRYKFGPSLLHPEFKRFVYDFPATLSMMFR
jgi:protein tyrosine/serine phosphatase